MFAPATEHSCAVRVGARGVLVRGASGSGKSTLVLALLSARPESAVLVADDRAILTVESGRLFAAAPEAIAGLIEIRGLGIVRRPHVSPAAIDLIVDLLPPAGRPHRMTAESGRTMLKGVSLPRVFVAVGAPEPSAGILAALGILEDRKLANAMT